MTEVKFSDGIIINIDGPPRAFRLADGWYVAGRGILTPANSEQEATTLLNSIFTQEEKDEK